MSDLNKANEILDKSLNVRIILLPPCTVAAYQFVGENPEEQAGDVPTRTKSGHLRTLSRGNPNF